MSTQTAGMVPTFTRCDRLRKAREVSGLSQTALASRLGIARSTVSTYESDPAAAFKPIVVRAWAMATGVDLAWLETGEAPHPAGPDEGLTEECASRDSNPEPADYVTPQAADVIPFDTRGRGTGGDEDGREAA